MPRSREVATKEGTARPGIRSRGPRRRTGRPSRRARRRPARRPCGDERARSAPAGDDPEAVPERRPLLAATPRSLAVRRSSSLATGLLGGGCGLAFGLTATALISAVFCWILVVVTRTDLEHKLIPNRIVVPGTVLVLVARTLDEPSIAWLARRARRRCRPARHRVHLSRRSRHGRREARGLPRRGPRRRRRGGHLRRVPRRVRARGRAPRQARAGGAEGGDPARPVSRPRRASWRSSRATTSSTGTSADAPARRCHRNAAPEAPFSGSRKRAKKPIPGEWNVHLRVRASRGRSTPRCSPLPFRRPRTRQRSEEEPVTAIDAAVASLHESIDGLFPSVFVLEHGHLWLVAQRGYAVVPDGIGDRAGGRRARGPSRPRPARHRRPLGSRTTSRCCPAVASEATVPLRVDRVTVGVLNLDSERPLPESTLKLLRPLAAALAPKTATLRASGRLDLPALARLFVYLGSLRDPGEIAALASASFARVLRLEASQVWMWDEVGRPVELASWASDARGSPLTAEELETARGLVDPGLVHQLVDVRGPRGKKRRWPSIWLPLRANGEDIGALVGTRRRRRQPRESRHGGRARGSCGRVARRRARPSARAAERHDGRADGNPQSPRPRGAPGA